MRPFCRRNSIQPPGEGLLPDAAHFDLLSRKKTFGAIAIDRPKLARNDQFVTSKVTTTKHTESLSWVHPTKLTGPTLKRYCECEHAKNSKNLVGTQDAAHTGQQNIGIPSFLKGFLLLPPKLLALTLLKIPRNPKEGWKDSSLIFRKSSMSSATSFQCLIDRTRTLYTPGVDSYKKSPTASWWIGRCAGGLGKLANPSWSLLAAGTTCIDLLVIWRSTALQWGK